MPEIGRDPHPHGRPLSQTPALASQRDCEALAWTMASHSPAPALPAPSPAPWLLTLGSLVEG